MRNRAIRLAALAGLSIALVGTSGKDPAACGPFLPTALFTYTKHPDLPLDRFARGELGVLQPTYARSYLTIAYRQLSGLSIGDAEARSLIDLWHMRLGLPAMTTAMAARTGQPSVDPVSVWNDARRAVTGEAAKGYLNTDREVPGGTYEWYRNIYDDALTQAAETLKARVATFGKDSAVVRDWIAAQDLVFTAGKEMPSQLVPLPANAPALARADRAYQIASAQFYAGEFSKARDGFQAIARDTASPWHAIAPYLAARALLRSAVLDAPDAAEAERRLQQAIAELDAVASNATVTEGLRRSSVGLREYAEYRRTVIVTQSGRFDALDANGMTVLAASPGDAIGPALDRFTRLLDRWKTPESTDPAAAAAAGASAGASPSPSASSRDLIDWLDVMQASASASSPLSPSSSEEKAAADRQAEVALSRWRARKTMPWLVATMMHAAGDMRGGDELLSAAANVPATSPAYATVAFHRARLLLERGDRQTARTILDDAIARTAPAGAVPLSASNQLRTLRLRTARTRAEFLEDAAKPSVLTTFDDYEQPTDAGAPEGEPQGERPTGSRLFDADATRLVNRLPLAEIVAAAETTSLSTSLRRDLAAVAWTRAIRLDNREMVLRIAPLLVQLAPALAEDVARYKATATREAAHAEATWMLLRFPGMSGVLEAGLGRAEPLGVRGMLRNNWWCSGNGVGPWYQVGAADRPASQREREEMASYLSTEQREAAAAELERLRTPSGSTYLAREAVAWAKTASPADTRVPQALHLAVVATRYGCTDDGTGAASKEAFNLLHSRFPSSPWTAKTPYWYK